MFSTVLKQISENLVVLNTVSRDVRSVTHRSDFVFFFKSRTLVFDLNDFSPPVLSSRTASGLKSLENARISVCELRGTCTCEYAIDKGKNTLALLQLLVERFLTIAVVVVVVVVVVDSKKPQTTTTDNRRW